MCLSTLSNLAIIDADLWRARGLNRESLELAQRVGNPLFEALRQLRRGWDRLSIYLPVVLMGLLALGSYWLLRATPEPVLPVAERPPQHEPDYFMRGFAVRSFAPDGSLRSEVRGTEARHYPDTNSTEIDQARIRSQQPGSPLTTATAQRVTSNADQTEFVLRGNAVVVREAAGANRPRLEFQGEHLRGCERRARRCHRLQCLGASPVGL